MTAFEVVEPAPTARSIKEMASMACPHEVLMCYTVKLCGVVGEQRDGESSLDMCVRCWRQEVLRGWEA